MSSRLTIVSRIFSRVVMGLGPRALITMLAMVIMVLYLETLRRAAMLAERVEAVTISATVVHHVPPSSAAATAGHQLVESRISSTQAGQLQVVAVVGRITPAVDWAPC